MTKRSTTCSSGSATAIWLVAATISLTSCLYITSVKGHEIFVYTTAGLKSGIIRDNPRICLQVEELFETGAWQSVVVTGEAMEIVDPTQRERAVDLIRHSNPTLLPALAIKWSNDWIRKNVEVVYRIKIDLATGRMTSEVRIAAAGVQPAICSSSSRN